MKITDAQLKQIYAHAQESYPHECCGFLLGDFDQGGLVHQIRRTANQNTERNDRFVISPKEFGEVHFAAAEMGLGIIGVYHSHPDWPPIPSQTDMDNAFKDMYYLIASVYKGCPFNTQVWRQANEGACRFEWVAMEIVGEKAIGEDQD